METLEVSRHAVKRIRERLGLPKKAAEAEAQRALENGLRIEETSGSFRKFLDRKHLERMDGSIYLTTPSGIYVVRDDTVVTVLPIPKDHAGRVMSIWKKKRLQ